MKEKQELKITVKIVPHPKPQQAIDLVAGLFLKNFLKEVEQEAS